MTPLTDMLATPIVETLGLTLVHFLWQGVIVALIMAALLYVLKNASAATRYRTACLGFALMSLLPVVTYAYLYRTSAISSPVAARAQPIATPSSPALETDTLLPPAPEASVVDARPTPFADALPAQMRNPASFVNLKTYLPWFVAIWLLGVVGLSVRLIGGLFLTHQLRTRATKPVSAVLEASLQTVLKKLGIRQQVKLRESLAVTVPVVIGWLRPVVLLPTSVITGLSQEQLELILAHELAHVRRYDYLVNILQKLVETVLFYHPAVSWLSGVIRQEREHCCDDLVVTLYQGQTLSYAQTLSQLETMRSSRLALAANDGSLLKRIQRLAGKPQADAYQGAGVSGLVLILLLSLILSLATAQASLPTEIEQNIDAFVEDRLEAWGGAPGAQVAIIQDGEVTFNSAYGLADVETGREMSIDTPILLGPEGSFYFVMLAVQQLIDEGQLSFDDTVADILPWVRFPDGEESEITAANLRDGDANIIDTIYPEGLDPFSETGIPGTLNPDITTAEEYIRSLIPDNLETASNRFTSFLNNDTLLILMVEEVSGLAFQDYMAQNVFEPLGMEATYAFEEAKQNGLATFYKNGEETLETVDISIPPPFGPALGLSMSSQDMAKFVMAVLEKDPQIFSEEAWEIFAPISTDLEEQANSWAGLLGSMGYSSGSQTVMEFIPSLKTGYVAMTNYQSDQASQPLVLDIAQSISTSLELLKEDSSVVSRSAREDGLSKASRYTLDVAPGRYLSALGLIELSAEEDELRGTLLGQDFRLDRFSNLYIIDSDYEPIDNLILTINAGKINIDNRPLAFKME